jgi:hypothetical protein
VSLMCTGANLIMVVCMPAVPLPIPLQMANELNLAIAAQTLRTETLGAAKLREFMCVLVRAIPTANMKRTRTCCGGGAVRPSVQAIIDEAEPIAVEAMRLWKATRRVLVTLVGVHWVGIVAARQGSDRDVWLTQVRGRWACMPLA